MKKGMVNANQEYKHYIYKEIGLIKSYKLLNETSESDGVIINNISIEINLESSIGREFYNEIKNKFKPEALPPKYASIDNYIYKETQQEEMIYIAIKILTNKSNPREIKAKKKLLHKINRYT